MRSPSPTSVGAPPPARGLLARSAAEATTAGALLGADHPLAALLQASQTAIDQMLALAALQAAATGLLLIGASLGLALLVTASALQLALGVRLLTLTEAKRDMCRRLIVQDAAPLQLAPIERERCRLADPRRRATLANSIERLADTAARPTGALPGARPYFDVRVVRTVLPELREIAALVRDEAPGIAGVALVERLLISPGSPLYGHEPEPLREQLARARYRLLVPRERSA